MIDDQVVLTAQRLRDGLAELRSAIRKRYKNPDRQVVADDLKARAAQLAETWMVELAPRADVAGAIEPDYLADANVQFQRLLSFSEHATKRKRYDDAIGAIVGDYTLQVVIPLKQLRNLPPQQQLLPHVPEALTNGFAPTAFVGHSFATADQPVVDSVIGTLTSLGLTVVTGRKPRADRISEKVKRLIEGQHVFVGIFTRRDKIARKNEWTTSAWVIEEKAYAVGRHKKLILIKEEGVSSIGGIQGDYEFLDFTRDKLHQLPVHLIEVFEISVTGLRT